MYSVFFFFNDTATTEIYTLSLHDALPIFHHHPDLVEERRDALLRRHDEQLAAVLPDVLAQEVEARCDMRSEEHTSELQSRQYLVCRLLLEKKNDEDTLLHNIDDISTNRLN